MDIRHRVKELEAVIARYKERAEKTEARLAELAAENVALMNRISWPQEQCPTTGAVTDVDPADFLPATDAAANALRAEGVDMFSNLINHTTDMLYADSIKSTLLDFANQLREGKA